MPVYEKRATLFLDILGFRSLIAAGRESDILSTLDIMPALNVQFEDASTKDVDFQSTTFSDCVVCSAKILARNNFMPAAFIALYAGALALHLLSKGILVRGAITVGELYHSDNVVFGPALIEAYELESKLAHYPRIIVPDKVYGRINLSLAVLRGADWFVQNQPFRSDFDGIHHLDILGPYFAYQRPRKLKIKDSVKLEDLGHVTTRIVSKICRANYKDPRISSKYEWLKSYLEDCCSRFDWKTPRFTKNRGFAVKDRSQS